MCRLGASLVFCALLSMVACTSIPPEKRVRDVIAQLGTIVKDYPEDANNSILIAKQGSKYHKIRVSKTTMEVPSYFYGSVTSATYRTIYAVDQNLQLCFGDLGSAEISCEKLKRDKDLRQYITW